MNINNSRFIFLPSFFSNFVAWISKPSKELNFIWVGITMFFDGKSLGILFWDNIFFEFFSKFITVGRGGLVEVALMYAIFFKSPVTSGVHSNPFPFVNTLILGLSTETLTICLLSISYLSLPVLAVKTSDFLSERVLYIHT